MSYKRNTKKNRKYTFKEDIVKMFLVLLNMVKLYHWKTCSYAAHKASDELYDSLNKNIDKFVEVLLGKLHGKRVNLTNEKTIPLIDFQNGPAFDEDMKREIMNVKNYLVNLDNNSFLLEMSNSDLFNIRDEILGSLNQFLYLLSFK
jgi:hypothetical protein